MRGVRSMKRRKPLPLVVATSCLAIVAALTGGAARGEEEKAAAPKEAAPAAMGQVSGSVFTPGRRIVRGASIALLPDAGPELYGTSTGEDGRYAQKGLVNGTYAVLVMDPGGNVLRKERVNVRPLFRNIVDFVTEPAGSPPAHIPDIPLPADAPPRSPLDVTGSLLTLDGGPISEAWVTIAPMGIDAPILRARTDAEGKFRLLRVGAGYYKVTARALGHVTWSLGPLLLEPGRDLTMRLTLLPFPLGHPMNPEDLLVPTSPMTPEEFAKLP